MQATFEMNARALPRLHFARRGTMMRSEKRRRSAPLPSSGPEPSPERPPRRERPRRAGAIYIAVTVLLLLVLWPIGLILLWQRRLRWGALTKLFVSVITMMACILLLGTLLTVETDNPTLTAAQNEAVNYLDSATDALVDFGASMGERANQSLYALNEIRALYQGEALNRAANAIDRGVEFSMNVRAWAQSLTETSSDVTADSESSTPAPTEQGGGEVKAAPSVRPTPAQTSVPAPRITVGAQDEELPVYIPEGEPVDGSGTPVSEGMLMRSGELDPDALPSPTPEPTPESYRFSVKPAAQAVVYFNIGSGRYYHMAPVCGSMKNADEHTLAEAGENIHTPCERCTPPDKSLLEERYVAWLDEDGIAHTSDECPEFSGQWTLITAEEAIEAEYEGCVTCEADRYLAAIADGIKVTLTPYVAPTAEPAADSDSDSEGASSASFTNAYGTPTTLCAHTGCTNYIAPSGDTNCCTLHSNRCLECKKYIDEDATYCVSCLAKAANQTSDAKPRCELCEKEGSYSIVGPSGNTEYYCYTHYTEMKKKLQNTVV